MPVALEKHEIAEVIPSLQRYLKSELDRELTGLEAKLLLDYLLKEIAPLAYNRGVKDAENYFRARVEDLAGSCFETGLSYWQERKR